MTSTDELRKLLADLEPPTDWTDEGYSRIDHLIDNDPITLGRRYEQALRALPSLLDELDRLRTATVTPVCNTCGARDEYCSQCGADDLTAVAGEAAERLRRELDELRSAARSMRSTLEAIRDFDPEVVYVTPDQLAEQQACEACASCRERNWPPSRLCNDHYIDQMTAENATIHNRNRMGWQFKTMARDALADPAVAALLGVEDTTEDGT